MNKNYKLKRWRDKREVRLKLDKYLCQECKRYGRTTEAKTVHHIYPTSPYPMFFWILDNLISLCNSCHEKMHDRQTGELTDKGKRWQEKVKRKVFKVSPP